MSMHKTESHEHALDEIVAFFKQIGDTTRVSQQLKNKHINKETQIRFLLMIDNVEDLISNDGIELRDIIQTLILDCPKLTIMVNSYEPIVRSTDNLDRCIIYVLELDDVKSVKMFMEITGELQAKEILKLVLH